MDANFRTILWQHLGATIDMLENAVNACPDALWGDPTKKPESWQDFWYMTYHTLFFLDFDMSPTPDGFMPPAPFTLAELDPAGVLPDRVYSKAELLAYLSHGREKCRSLIAGLTDQTAQEPSTREGFSRLEVLIQTMRHVQHHAAQLNLLLRQNVDDAPLWVGRTRRALDV
jgi:hypothetical protein